LSSTPFSSSSRKLLLTTRSRSRLLTWEEVNRSHRVCTILPIVFHIKYTLGHLT
jgi:hypothetical protein